MLKHLFLNAQATSLNTSDGLGMYADCDHFVPDHGLYFKIPDPVRIVTRCPRCITQDLEGIKHALETAERLYPLD